jgi:predicted acylesterase/phospholipase RssA
MTDRKECDLIMKGGITSGVVYPEAVLELHEEYDFRSIGGASAGAIAAAATAAAQFDPAGGGFARLRDLSSELRRPGVLSGMFQASGATRPLFEFFLGTLSAAHRLQGGGKSKAALAAAILVGLARSVPAALVLGGIAGYWSFRGAVHAVHGQPAAAPVFAAAAVVAGSLLFALAQFGWIVFFALPANNLGICKGLRAPSSSTPALSEWLTTKLNELAGRKPDDDPITFGDLAEKEIVLQLITTDLSEMQPYALPFWDNRFLVKKQEMEEYFPGPVVRFMEERQHRSGRAIPPAGFFFLPDAPFLPLVFGVRLSLSFPVLISSVPLYAVRAATFQGRAAPVQLAEADLRRHWFSDGGICSNFPIHFFDRWLPGRPTFGISLEAWPEDETSTVAKPLAGTDAQSLETPSAAVYLPKANRPEAAAWREVDGVIGLFTAVFDTAMSYRDQMQTRMPGFRERIVQIRLKPDEGGLNLDMPPRRISLLADRGRMAGELLRRSFDFPEHRWVRLQALMPALAEQLEELQAILGDRFDVRDWFPPGGPYRRDGKWMASAQKCLTTLAAAGTQLELEQLQRPDPKPQGALRVTPKI